MKLQAIILNVEICTLKNIASFLCDT